jgi:hypothetical protein
MNWDAIGAIGEIVGAAGVVITLMYLALQMKQNSKTIEAQMYQARSEVSANRYGQIADSPYLATIYSKLESEKSQFDPEKVDDLTPEELTRLKYSEGRLLRSIDNVVYQHAMGFIPADFVEAVKVTVRIRYGLWVYIGIPQDSRASLKQFIEGTINGDDT